VVVLTAGCKAARQSAQPPVGPGPIPKASSLAADKGDGVQNPWLDQDMQPLGLSEAEIDDVVAFLASLTSAQYLVQGETELASQREIAHTSRAQRDTARAFGPKPVQPDPKLVCPASH
jgi:hypothetical protein